MIILSIEETEKDRHPALTDLEPISKSLFDECTLQRSSACFNGMAQHLPICWAFVQQAPDRNSAGIDLNGRRAILR
jgi:hypothetical protein